MRTFIFNRTCLTKQNLSDVFCRTNIKRYLPTIIVNCISHPPWTQKAVYSPRLWVNGYHITQRDVQKDIILSSYGSWGLRLESISDTLHHIPHMNQHRNHCNVTIGWCFRMAIIMLVTLGVVFREAFLFPVFPPCSVFGRKYQLRIS